MNTTPNKKPRSKPDPSVIRKRRLKRKLKITAFFACVVLVTAALVWGVVKLIGNDNADENSPQAENSFVSETSQYVPSSSPESLDNAENSDLSQSEPSVDISSVPSEPDEEEWNLILINGNNPVPEDYELNLIEMEGETIRGGGAAVVDARIVEPLQKMLAAAREDGIIPKITSAYRSIEDQKAVMEEYINDYITNESMTREEAEAEARRWVALPGTSEHQIGIAVDISTADWSAQGADVVWAWLEENCWKYGFILRYTEEWASITGAAAEPWHFRYVGEEHAKDITDSGLPFEQYLEQNQQ